MVQQNSTPPSGPRLTRRSRGHDKSPPLSSSAGIRKRRNGPLRVDKDGDLEMEAGAESGGGRGSRGRGSDQNAGGAAGRSGARNGTSRGGISSAATQKAILRSMGSGAATVRGPRRGLNVSKIIREATDQGSGWEKGEGLHQINVTGWRRSTAASNSDGGVNDLLAFLKRKATIPGRPASEASKIIKSRIEGDTLVIFVKPEDMGRILRLNTYTFAGATLAIEERAGTARRTDSITTREASEDTLDMRQKLTVILNRRYNSELKLLNLSSLGNDPELVKMGMFDTTSTESKFFPALMKVSDLIFNSPQQKREAVVSVTLADNMLSDIKSVTTLSQAFPDLKNLDLSNNKLKDLRSLDGWRWKFRHLDHLVLTGNPIEAEILTYKDEILKWYPTLRILNGIQVRADEDITAASKGKLPIPILAASFRDEASIGENFIKQFFPTFDTDRIALANGYYDAQSTFSLSVNTSAPRASEQPVGHEKMKPLAWDAYIKKSRNLLKVTHLPSRMSRAYVGTEAIRDSWTSLPSTRHPDLLGEPQKWLIECHSLPGLPDPTGQSPGGVGGLIVMVHGEFYEIDQATGQPTMERSFDRTFVLGPGGGVGGIRVISDILTLRAWGGSAAWVPESVEGNAAPTSSSTQRPQMVDGLGISGPGKSEEQIQKEAMVLELSKVTGMTVEYSTMCLEQSGWSLEGAAKAFELAKANLPPEAFL